MERARRKGNTGAKVSRGRHLLHYIFSSIGIDFPNFGIISYLIKQTTMQFVNGKEQPAKSHSCVYNVYFTRGEVNSVS